MQSLNLKQIKQALMVFLAIGVFSFFTASIISMPRMNMAMDSCVVMFSSNTQSSNSSTCLSYHLNIFHSTTEVSVQSFSSLALLLAVSFLASFGLLALTELLEGYYSRMRIRYKHLYQKTILVFFEQLGFWLSLFEKRDPSQAFVTA